jgi:hypothetical protein
MKKILITLSIFALTGCATASRHEISQEDVQEFFRTHRVGSSPDYAVMKNGTDYLATIHGMVDDKSACLDLIKPYNEDPSLSTLPGAYTCVPLNN